MSSPQSPKPSRSLLTPSDLSPDQIKAVAELQRLQKCCLWAKPGAGKTTVALTAVDGLFCSKVLIVGTKRIIDLVWRQEAAAWSHLKDCTFEMITGTPAQRLAKLQSPAQYHLINYELLEWLVDATKGAWPYDAIIFDEVSKMKAPGTNRFIKMRQVIGAVPVRIGLTGTPRGNSILGLWGQLFMTAGPVLAPTMSDYKARWFYPVDDKRLIWRPNAGAEAEIKRIAAPYVHVPPENKTTDDAIINPVMIELPPAAQAIYDELERELMVSVDGKDIIATNEAIMRGKLLQVSSGAVYDHGTSNWTHLHDAKLDALEELLDELDGEQVLIFYRFKHEQERLQARWPKMTNDIRRWLGGSPQLLGLHPQSGGHGLNLHVGGCCTQVWLSLPDSLELWEQGNHRLARTGQEREVTAHVLTVAGGVEEKLVRSLAGLARMEAQLIEDVRNG